MAQATSIDTSRIEELIDLYLEIEHSTIIDGEVTLNGNGTNAYEAANVIETVFDVLGIETPKATRETFARFCKIHGIDKREFVDYFDEV